jgi:acetyl-CoA synthetase
MPSLQEQANRLSNVLTAASGCTAATGWPLCMPQRFETAVAYMAVLQMGAVAMPLSMLFGPEALEYRLHDSEAVRGHLRWRRLSTACSGCARTARCWRR